MNRESWMFKTIAGGMVTIIFSLLTGAFKNIVALQSEVRLLNQIHQSQSVDIKELKESRDNMKNYYVTRQEFNNIIETQNKKLDNLYNKTEKIVDILMSQKNKRGN